MQPKWYGPCVTEDGDNEGLKRGGVFLPIYEKEIEVRLPFLPDIIIIKKVLKLLYR